MSIGIHLDVSSDLPMIFQGAGAKYSCPLPRKRPKEGAQMPPGLYSATKYAELAIWEIMYIANYDIYGIFLLY